jgi:hypothetical protein
MADGKRLASSAFEPAKSSPTLNGTRVSERSKAPSGTGPSVVFAKPLGAPKSATTEPGLIPSFFGSGVPE